MASVLFAAILLCAVTAILLLFFRVRTVRVENSVSSFYTGEQIIAASGVEKGQNLLFVKKSGIIDLLLKELPYIGRVTVEKRLPDTVVIRVSETTDYAAIPYRGGYLTVSKDLKILSDGVAAPTGIPMIYGITPKSFSPGADLAAENPAQLESLAALLEQMTVFDLFGRVTAVSVRDRLDLSIVYENRIFVRIGTANQMAYKFEMLFEVTERQLETDYGGSIDLTTAGEARVSPPGEVTYPNGYFDIGEEEAAG